MESFVKETAQESVARLIAAGHTPATIAEALGCVHARTVYRWGRGETAPRNAQTYQALCALAQRAE